MAITAFLSRSPGLLNRGSGGPASLGHGPHSSIFSPTGLISNCLTSCLYPGYIIVQRPPSSCGHHKSHSFNPSTVKVISWYSSTGCTCYLHRRISYFDSLAGVNMLHLKKFKKVLFILTLFFFIFKIKSILKKKKFWNSNISLKCKYIAIYKHHITPEKW